jgi:hypothetical protein
MAANWPDEFEECRKKNGTRQSESDRLAPTLGCLFALKANGKWSAARRHQRMSVRTKVAEKVKILLLFTNFLEIARNCLSTNSIIFKEIK